MGVSDSDPTLDIHALFCHYNALYFDDSLGACVVSWTSSPLPSGASSCDYFPGGGCEILLSKPLLEFQPIADLKNVLLHEMIHAYMCINYENKDHSDHGTSFQAMMNSINSSTAVDYQKPVGGYSITILHELRNIYDSYRCSTCGDLIKSTMNREPSVLDCTENVGPDGFCDNLSCHWHRKLLEYKEVRKGGGNLLISVHKKLCTGNYIKVDEPPGCLENRSSSKAEQVLHEGKPKELPCMSKETRQRAWAEGTNKKFEIKKKSTANFFQSAGDPARSSGDHSASIDGSGRKAIGKDSKDIHSLAVAQEIPKRTRSLISRKHHDNVSRKRRKLDNSKNYFTIIIEWLNLFTEEESEEDSEPLINKRTERRRKQKLLNSLKSGASSAGVEGDVLPSNISCRNKDAGSCSLGLEHSITSMRGILMNDEHLQTNFQAHAGNSSIDTAETTDYSLVVGTLDDQCGSACLLSTHASVKSRGLPYEGSPFNSPVRGEIVDISDG
ncbi:uncharacterized protein [Typha latifolia]|uniref:uncharacterized protein isoform X1 n=1 Tax=Typha latifolia TaxID=4733 RepID=UPI003C2C35C9